jgi:hypothetical protein
VPPIVRRVGVPAELAVFAVTTHETDQVTGVVLLLETAPVPVEILGEPVGTMVGQDDGPDRGRHPRTV